jgi:hypothetical protein
MLTYRVLNSETANEAFQAAYERFIDSLPQKERSRYAPCASAEDFLDSLGHLEALSSSAKKSRGRKLVQRIQKFGDRLQPYFDAIGFLAQTNQYACIAWGSLRLVLQVSMSVFTMLSRREPNLDLHPLDAD